MINFDSQNNTDLYKVLDFKDFCWFLAHHTDTQNTYIERDRLINPFYYVAWCSSNQKCSIQTSNAGNGCHSKPRNSNQIQNKLHPSFNKWSKTNKWMTMSRHTDGVTRFICVLSYFKLMSCIFYNLRNSFSIEMFRRLEKKITFQSHLINRNCFSSIYLFPTLIVFQSLLSLLYLYLFLSLFLVATVCNYISFCLSPDRRFLFVTSDGLFYWMLNMYWSVCFTTHTWQSFKLNT